MAALALGGVLAACGAALWRDTRPGLAVAALGFLLVGAGAGAAGTNVLAMLAAAWRPRAAPRRRPSSG